MTCWPKLLGCPTLRLCSRWDRWWEACRDRGLRPLPRSWTFPPEDGKCVRKLRGDSTTDAFAIFLCRKVCRFCRDGWMWALTWGLLVGWRWDGWLVLG